MTLRSSTLGDYLLPVRSVNPLALFGDRDFTYVDISAIDRERRAIISPQGIATTAAPSRARQEIAEGDVIVSTVRPNLNTVAMVSIEHAGAIASTGFCVLRPIPSMLDAGYIFHWITSEATVSQLVKLATGATYPAVSDKTIKSLPFAPPPLMEQKRIAAILDKSDSLRSKRQEAIRLADDFLRAVFIDMFGDPVSNTKAWSVKSLGDVCKKIGSGATPRGGDAAYKEEGIALIRSMNVRDGHFLWKDLARIDDEQAGRLSNVVVQADDVLINITGASVARVCRAPESAIPARVNQHVSILRTTAELLPAFLEQLLLTATVKSQLLKIGEAGATRQAITKAELEAFKIIVPPMDAQAAFGVIRSKVADLVRKASASDEAGEYLSASLGHQYFGQSE